MKACCISGFTNAGPTATLTTVHDAVGPAFRTLLFFDYFGTVSITTTHLHAKVITLSGTPASTLDAGD